MKQVGVCGESDRWWMYGLCPVRIILCNGRIRQSQTSDESNLNRGPQSMGWEERKLGFMLPFCFSYTSRTHRVNWYDKIKWGKTKVCLMSTVLWKKTD